jgi:outer membrane protein assembly factor BamB
MRVLWWLLLVVLAGFAVAAATTAVRPATGAAAASSATDGPRGAAVLQYHKHASRDGLYVEPALTQAAARRFHRDLTFDAPLSGPTYAQPLFWAATGPTDRDLLVVATEQNQVYAFDAASGATVWRRSIAPPVSQARLPCGNIDPLGITGTPVIDPASRTVFLTR